MRPVLVLLLLVTAAHAEGPMRPDDFEAWATGRTLSYSVDGRVLGSETYLPGREVRDADTDGPCVEGRWFAEGDAVCFVYPSRPGVHCWTYWREGEAVFAKPLNSAPDAAAQRVTDAASPLSCPGPEVGT